MLPCISLAQKCLEYNSVYQKSERTNCDKPKHIWVGFKLYGFTLHLLIVSVGGNCKGLLNLKETQYKLEEELKITLSSGQV